MVLDPHQVADPVLVADRGGPVVAIHVADLCQAIAEIAEKGREGHPADIVDFGIEADARVGLLGRLDGVDGPLQIIGIDSPADAHCHHVIGARGQ